MLMLLVIGKLDTKQKPKKKKRNNTNDNDGHGKVLKMMQTIYIKFTLKYSGNWLQRKKGKIVITNC